MPELRDPRAEEPCHGAPVWRNFRRARHALWGSLLVAVVAGAALHDVTAHSFAAKASWLVGVVVLLSYPLRYLFGFRCPRCGGIYLATGRLRDFLGLGRILWGNRCGSCSLPAGDLGSPRASDIPSSRPVI